MILKALRFLAENFSVPLIFFVVFRIWGDKPAIGVAIVAALAQSAVYLMKGRRPSPLFVSAAVLTLVSGTIDLVLDEPRYFRFSAFLQNFLVGSAVLVAMILRLPVALWFARTFPERLRPDPSRLPPGYLTGITALWALYFFLKAVIYFWLALRVDLGQLQLLRSVVGWVSAVILLGGEIAWRKWRYERPAER